MKSRFHRWSVAIVLAGAWTAGCQAAAPTPAQVAQRAHAYMQARADAGHFSGTVLLARDGKPLFMRSYGFADAERRIENHPTTRYPIASITKTFTAALVMKLQQQGLLAVEDLVCRHIDDCPQHWQAITIRHLLTHTAGLPDYARTADFPRKMGEPRTRDQLVAEFRDRPLEFAPGAQYRYSNSGYVVLGIALEKAARKPYARLLQELILTPLGMRDSGVASDPGAHARSAIGYRPDGVRNAIADPVDPSWLFAVGDIYSTVGDLLKWDQALHAGKVLPRAQLDAMWSAQHGAYGFGWQLLAPSPQSLNRRLVFHAGGLTGFATDLLSFPDDGVTVVLLANLLPVSLAEISRDLGAIVFGEGYSPPVVRRAVPVDPSIYDAYVGRYQLTPTVEIAVSRDGDRLIVQATGQPADVAIPESPTTFYSRISPVRVSFVKDDSGKVVRLTLHEPGRDIAAPRK